jgi:hypothetical protein
VTSNPHTHHAANRAADLALIAAVNDPLCPVTGTARTLLAQQIGDKPADRLISEARAVLWRDPANPAENAMTAEDDALHVIEQGS